MEKVYQQSVQITENLTDGFGRLKSSALLYLAQNAATAHCQLLSLDWDTLSKRNLFWAVIRHRVEVTRLPLAGETITVETWPMPTTRVAYPRATTAYDAQGKELFRMVSLWVLMNQQSRAMVLPGKSGVTVDGLLRGTELELPGNLPVKQAAGAVLRQVQYTELDRNLHMNNTRYLDWVEDLLPGIFHQSHPLKRATICYLSEMREGQEAILNWQLSNDGTLFVSAHRADGREGDSGQRVFTANMEF